MKHLLTRKAAVLLTTALAATAFSTLSFADDDGPSEFKAMLKKGDCFKCHALEKAKKGPSYKKIAAKYKGKEAEGETKMFKNVTTGPKVKLEDGTEEDHKIIEASEKDTKALIKWILTL